MFHDPTCFVLFLENIKQAKWFSLNGSFLKSTIFFCLGRYETCQWFLKMAFAFDIFFWKILSSVNELKWVFFQLDNFCCGKENIFNSMILNGWVFFSIGQILFWKGKYLQVNYLKWVSVFCNWAILFWKGKYLQVNYLKWVSVFFNWAILFWKGKYLQFNDLKWVSVFFRLGNFCCGKDNTSQMVES